MAITKIKKRFVLTNVVVNHLKTFDLKDAALFKANCMDDWTLQFPLFSQSNVTNLEELWIF